MGLGKTTCCLGVVTSDLMAARRDGTRIAPTLIVCPTSVVDSWETEILSRFEPAFRPNWARYYAGTKPSANQVWCVFRVLVSTVGLCRCKESSAQVLT